MDTVAAISLDSWPTSSEQKPQLSDAWNYDAGKLFLESISEMVAPSTALGYHNCLANARLFLTCQGIKPPNHKQVSTGFAVLARGASSKRSKYLKSTKLAKAKKFKVLSTFYRVVYHSPETWKWFAELVKACRNGEKVSKGNLRKVIRHLIAVLSTNFKRSGNIALLKFSQVMEALNEAFQAF